MTSLTILLVEDDPAACAAFAKCIAESGEARLVAVTGDADQALRDIKDHLPEVILLDLELHQGGGSGLDVLQGIGGLGLDVSPYVVVTTNNASPVTYDYARELGAGYIFHKHQRGYSEKKVLELLLAMKKTIHRRYGYSSPGEPTPETPAQHRSRLIRRIHAELDRVGVSAKSKGYAYLTDAILMVIEQPRQHLCIDVAQKYGVTESSAERAMQNAINRAWQLADINDLLTHYTGRIHSERGVPTLTEFVYYYAKKIKDAYSDID